MYCLYIFCSDDSSVCIHSDDEIAPVAYLQLKQLSLVEKTERVVLNQPVFNCSTFSMEKLTNISSQKSVEGMCAVKAMVIKHLVFLEKTSVFHCGPFTWISVSNCKSNDPAAVAESALLTIKGHILNHSSSILKMFPRHSTDYEGIR